MDPTDGSAAARDLKRCLRKGVQTVLETAKALWHKHAEQAGIENLVEQVVCDAPTLSVLSWFSRMTGISARARLIMTDGST